MRKSFLLFGLVFFVCSTVLAQEPVVSEAKIDTLKDNYVNPGKVAGRRAVYGSLILPGLGQLRNALDRNSPRQAARKRMNIYRGAKIVGIYTAFTMLTISFQDNNKKYHFFLDEIKYRRDNEGKPRDPYYAQSSEAQLLQAKDIYRRNKEVIIVSYFGVYVIGAIDAYVDARLNYFNVDDNLSMRFSPTLINTGEQYGFNSYPGVKFSLKF